jgi:2-polyprenyl-6-methoxyphenol hydroxylase-like FAD-dependent oxidoreductase
MSRVRKVLVIGGGIAGMCSAIQLRKIGVEVDLVEIDPEWRVYGAGITISGPTLRAFKEIGVLDEIIAQGWCADGCTIALADGTVLGEIPTPRIAGDDVPGAGAIMRPLLARILSKATLASGAKVRLGVTFTAIEQDADACTVHFTDGTQSSYDLVIGADGVLSKTRQVVFPEMDVPAYTGQGCWRAVVARPPEIDHAHMFMTRDMKVGVNPVSDSEMYLFLLERIPEDAYIPVDAWPARLATLLKGFTGVIGDIRDNLNADSRIVYRPLHNLLVKAPWHKGNVVLIGDAVHATTPHLASGAGISVEDALVLVEELAAEAPLADTLARFTARRFERARMVVESSQRLGVLEASGSQEAKTEHAMVMRHAMTALLAPL